jgi:uncharacterized protein
VLREKIGVQMREAMKAREQARVSTLRMLMTAIRNAEVDRRHPLDDDEVIDIASKEAKRRKESIEAFKQGGREDLVAKEEIELAVLEAYLPQALSEAELAALVDEAIASTGASEPKQMGEVMKALMPKIRGRADGATVSALVRSKLGP